MIFLWISLYGFIYEVFDKSPVAMFIYAMALVRWIGVTNRFSRIGIQKPVLEKKYWYTMIPLLGFPLINLLVAKAFWFDFSLAFLMLSVAIVEEIFFRGFLLQSLMRLGKKRAIFITSFVFGVFHFVNLYRAANLRYVLLQVMYAFAVGAYYSIMAIKTNSILPCVLSHFLINITGT